MKNIISVLLIVCLIAFVNTACANISKVHPVKYTALGDSIASGYALSDYTVEKGSENSYVSYVERSLADIYGERGVVTEKIVVNGLTTDGLIEKIGKNKNKVRNADIITVTIGSNDLMTIFRRVMKKHLGDIDLSALKDSNNIQDYICAYEKLLLTKGELENSGELDNACRDFPKKLDKLFGIIKGAAPDADVYVTNIYNPFKGIEVSGINFFDFAEKYISEINRVIAENKSCTAVDIHSAFINAEQNAVNIQDDAFSFDPHPNLNGHKIIADEIIKYISANRQKK